ncbi:hypothetical protein Ahia01_000501400 [Argonauta hians]
MYLKKAKRYFDVPDTKDAAGEKQERNCEQTNSHAICMGKLRAAANNSSSTSLPTSTADVLSFVNDDLDGEQQSSPTESEKEFHPEDLPDGACFRPKSVLVNSDTDHTAIRPAEYIGSFSVIGVDQGMRTNFVKKHLEDMRDVVKSIKVLLVISLSGVKVCSSKGESVYMAHALKRISFATCDPDYCQFSFLAREPKGQINVQFCHAFITRNSPEAEELNTIIGNAFKMAYAQQRQRQPTFNELIERQIEEQKAKFAEDQEQAERDLQQKLNEIATPTPFSEKAIQRMEMRRQLSEETAQEREKEQQQQQQSSSAALRSWLWGRQTTERVKHRSPVTELMVMADRGSPPPPSLIKFQQHTASSNTSSSSPSSSSPLSSAAAAHLRPTSGSTSSGSSSGAEPYHVNSQQQQRHHRHHHHHGQQRNSVPPGVSRTTIATTTTTTSTAAITTTTIATNSLSVSALQQHCFENFRVKGSPVTALKDQIDKHFSGCSFESLDLEFGSASSTILASGRVHGGTGSSGISGSSSGSSRSSGSSTGVNASSGTPRVSKSKGPSSGTSGPTVTTGTSGANCTGPSGATAVGPSSTVGTSSGLNGPSIAVASSTAGSSSEITSRSTAALTSTNATSSGPTRKAGTDATTGSSGPTDAVGTDKRPAGITGIGSRPISYPAGGTVSGTPGSTVTTGTRSRPTCTTSGASTRTGSPRTTGTAGTGSRPTSYPASTSSAGSPGPTVTTGIGTPGPTGITGTGSRPTSYPAGTGIGTHAPTVISTGTGSRLTSATTTITTTTGPKGITGTDPSDTYLYPTTSSLTQTQQGDKPKLSSIQNRPLPALPIERNGHCKTSLHRSSLQNLSTLGRDYEDYGGLGGATSHAAYDYDDDDDDNDHMTRHQPHRHHHHAHQHHHGLGPQKQQQVLLRQSAQQQQHHHHHHHHQARHHNNSREGFGSPKSRGGASALGQRPLSGTAAFDLKIQMQLQQQHHHHHHHQQQKMPLPPLPPSSSSSPLLPSSSSSSAAMGMVGVSLAQQQHNGYGRALSCDATYYDIGFGDGGGGGIGFHGGGGGGGGSPPLNPSSRLHHHQQHHHQQQQQQYQLYSDVPPLYSPSPSPLVKQQSFPEMDSATLQRLYTLDKGHSKRSNSNSSGCSSGSGSGSGGSGGGGREDEQQHQKPPPPPLQQHFVSVSTAAASDAAATTGVPHSSSFSPSRSAGGGGGGHPLHHHHHHQHQQQHQQLQHPQPSAPSPNQSYNYSPNHQPHHHHHHHQQQQHFPPQYNHHHHHHNNNLNNLNNNNNNNNSSISSSGSSSGSSNNSGSSSNISGGGGGGGDGCGGGGGGGGGFLDYQQQLYPQHWRPTLDIGRHHQQQQLAPGGGSPKHHPHPHSHPYPHLYPSSSSSASSSPSKRELYSSPPPPSLSQLQLQQQQQQQFYHHHSPPPPAPPPTSCSPQGLGRGGGGGLGCCGGGGGGGGGGMSLLPAPSSSSVVAASVPCSSSSSSSTSAQPSRYQNDTNLIHYQGYYQDSSMPNSPSRLESLMGLDRSHIEDETLRHASWYQAGIPREIALEILLQEEIGSFIVRDSTTHPGCYALSVKVPKYMGGISHYLILKTQRGVKLKGLDKEWPNLASLVTHHTVMREMLPCTLKLPRNSQNPTFKDTDKDDKDEDPDYQRLSDFTTMMADLKM